MPLLQIFDFKERRLLEPVELYPAYSGISNPDGTSVSDAIADFSVEENTDLVYYVVRHKVFFDSPDRAGTATKDSSADLYKVRLPTGRPEKIVSFDAVKTDRSQEDGIPYDIPIVAYKQGPRILIKWWTRIESMDERTLKRTLIAKSDTTSSFDLHVAANGSRALITETRGASESNVSMDVDELLGTERKKIITTNPHFQVLWNPDYSQVILKGGSGGAVTIRLSDGKLAPFNASFGQYLDPLALLSNSEALVQIPNEGREVEQPVTEDNYNIPLAVLNLTTNELTYLQNHRTPLFLGLI